MKAVSAPPAPSKDFLPPPGDKETGWKRGIVEAERSINHALTVSHPFFQHGSENCAIWDLAGSYYNGIWKVCILADHQ
jgi:hypothetical protein